MTLRTFFTRNILANDPAPTPSRLDRMDRPYRSLVPINHDAHNARTIDAHVDDPWSHVRARD